MKSILDNNMTYEMIGKIFMKLRKEKNYNQSIIAKRMGIDRTTVSAYERGCRKMSLLMFRKFVKLFNVSADSILFGEDTDIVVFRVKKGSKKHMKMKAIDEAYDDDDEDI